MLSNNLTPFAAMGFAQLHRDGRTMACLAVRGSFEIPSVNGLRLAEPQELIYTDVYDGDPHRNPMSKTGDLVPFKPAADVTLVGNAYAPGKRPSRSWNVKISVANQSCGLRVSGPREWLPGLRRFKPSWNLGEADAAEMVALDYRLASGGRHIGDPEGNVDRRNPIGSGLLDGKYTRFSEKFPAPQIDAVHAAIDGPYDAPEPQGFGPISPWWIQRQQYAGTYDENWKTNIHPRLPDDFDYRFYQCAHPSLIMPGYLQGGEKVTVEGCRPGGETVSFSVPEIGIVAEHAWSDGRKLFTRLNLDGLHMDFRGDVPRFDLTWRGWIARSPDYLAAELNTATLATALNYPSSDEDGVSEISTIKKDVTT